MSKSIDQKSNKIYSSWKSPSNIALIKYWGKHGRQLPNNASISFTLSHASTTTSVIASPRPSNEKLAIDFLFEGQSEPNFGRKIDKFLTSIRDEFFPFLYSYHLEINTANTFPHSSGIASSASGMSALALCLCDIDQQLSGQAEYNESFFRKASIIARLGSGSAARSVFPTMSVWGQHPQILGSDDQFAIGIQQNIDPVFKTFHDDILIVSEKQKSVSSTAGHNLMNNNPYAKARYHQAGERMSQLMKALESGDVETFGKITEDEALTLHALMMCSDPSYILLEEGTLSVIKWIRQFRAESNIPVYFTLDAGPNVHILYPDQYTRQVEQFIADHLQQYAQNGRIIKDFVGQGPEKLG